MTRRLVLLTALVAALAGCARSRADAEHAPVEEIALAQAAPDTLTETEERVRDLLAEDGVYVVHFWAPWCHNSRAEFRAGVWNEIIEAHEDVTFIFVTVFNNGDLGERTLTQHEIPERVHTFAQPDHGRSRIKANRRTTFLGLPLTWTPTTWIFHRNGTLAFAVNYGEVRPALMATLLANAHTDWSH